MTDDGPNYKVYRFRRGGEANGRKAVRDGLASGRRKRRVLGVEAGILRLGALATALAAIVGLATLLWPDAPKRVTATVERVDADANVSLADFSTRQRLAHYAPGGPGHTAGSARVRFASLAVQAPPQGSTSQKESAPPEGQPTAPENESTAPEGKSTTPEGEPTTPEGGPMAPEGEGDIKQKDPQEVIDELDTRLPAPAAPSGSKTTVKEGQPMFEAQQDGDIRGLTDDPQGRVVNARMLVRILRGTRARPLEGQAGASEPVGVSVNFTATFEGVRGKPVEVRWTLYDARGGQQVPRDWLVNRRALVVRPSADSHRASDEFWVPLPQRRGPFFVRLSILDERHSRLDFADTRPFS